jgi:hypothetical protein
MDGKTQRRGLAVVGLALLGSMLLVQWREASERAGASEPRRDAALVTPRSAACLECHEAEGRGITEPWRGSVHARVGVGCVECHAATREQADGYDHYGERIVTSVTPRTCASCHPVEGAEFAASAHARAAELLATPAAAALAARADGETAARSCESCHGSTVQLVGTGDERIESAHLRPDADGRPTAREIVGRVARDADGLPAFDATSWPNAGAGRRNLDGSLGSCATCHGRHDFSARRARRPESCAPCHHGAEQPEAEIFAASRHGVRWAEVADRVELERDVWRLGRDYSAAPSCATCHMSGHTRGGGAITHDPGSRLGWQHSADGSRRADTDAEGRLPRGEPGERAEPPAQPWQDKRERMRQVCLHCHAATVVRASFDRLDSFVVAVDARFSAPTTELRRALVADGLCSPADFDDPLEWQSHAVTHVGAMTAKLGMAMGSPEHAAAEGALAASRTVCAELLPELGRALGRLDDGRGGEQARDATRRAAATLALAAGCGPFRTSTPP